MVNLTREDINRVRVGDIITITGSKYKVVKVNKETFKVDLRCIRPDGYIENNIFTGNRITDFDSLIKTKITNWRKVLE